VFPLASGVRWNEAYTDASSDRRKMLDLQTQQCPGALLQFMATSLRAAPAGTEWNYSTGETYVLGALVRAAVKRPLSQYLSEKIWSRFAMEKMPRGGPNRPEEWNSVVADSRQPARLRTLWPVRPSSWSSRQKPTGSAVVSDDAFFAGVLQALH